MNVKLAVENFLDNEKVIIPSALNLANYEHKFVYKNREAIFENFNMFGRVTSLNMFKSMWKDADAKIYQCVKEDYFMVVFDYNRQYETLTNVYSPFGNDKMKRNFTVGEVYRPRVHIKKVKNGKATVIRVSGEDYILRHKDQFRGGKTEMKTLESIREEIWEEMLRLEDKRKDQWADIKYQTLREVLQKLGHLDEPEVLSQEKVQIPWFVYKWIEHQKMFDFNIYDLLSLASKGKWATESMNKFINENGELFIKAWLAYPNIEIKEEPKYYVINKENELLLSKNNEGEVITYSQDYEQAKRVLLDLGHYQLTEQEIKDYDPRYWAFREPVEEMEE